MSFQTYTKQKIDELLKNLDETNLKVRAATDKGKTFVVTEDGSWTLGDLASNIGVDNVTIEKNTDDKLQVKDGGISKAKLNSGLVDTTVSSASTDDTLPTSKAVYDSLKGNAKSLEADTTDNSLKLKDTTGTVLSTVASSSISEITKADTVELSNKTIDADKNTISNLEGDNLKAQTATDKGKTWVVQADGTWALGKAGAETDNVTIGVNSNDKLEVLDGSASTGLTVAKFKTGVLDTTAFTTADDEHIASSKLISTSIDAVGHKVTMALKTGSEADYIYELKLLDKNDNVLSTQEVDLPLEKIKIVSLEYDNTTEKLILKWQDAAGVEHTLEIPASSILKGVVTETATQTLTNKTINADNNTISNLEVDNLKSGVLQTTIRESATATDEAIASEKAIRTALDEVETKLTLTGVAPIEIDYTTKEISVKVASTSNKGVTQLATVEETKAGTDETSAVTPKGLNAAVTDAITTERTAIATLKNKTIDTADNTIKDIDKGNLKAQATTDAGKAWIVQTDGSWALGEVSAKTKVDDVTIEYNADDKLQVKDSSITTAKLAVSVVDGVITFLD